MALRVHINTYLQTNAHTHTRNACARARTNKRMYRIATQERTQNMTRIA